MTPSYGYGCPFNEMSISTKSIERHKFRWHENDTVHNTQQNQVWETHSGWYSKIEYNNCSRVSSNSGKDHSPTIYNLQRINTSFWTSSYYCVLALHRGHRVKCSHGNGIRGGGLLLKMKVAVSRPLTSYYFSAGAKHAEFSLARVFHKVSPFVAMPT